VGKVYKGFLLILFWWDNMKISCRYGDNQIDVAVGGIISINGTQIFDKSNTCARDAARAVYKFFIDGERTEGLEEISVDFGFSSYGLREDGKWGDKESYLEDGDAEIMLTMASNDVKSAMEKYDPTESEATEPATAGV
jgi:hypothetical protein